MQTQLTQHDRYDYARTVIEEPYELTRYRRDWQKTVDLIEEYIDSYYLGRAMNYTGSDMGGTRFKGLSQEEKCKLTRAIMEDLDLNTINDSAEILCAPKIKEALKMTLNSDDGHYFLRQALVEEVYCQYQRIIEDIFCLCDEHYIEKFPEVTRKKRRA